MLVSSVRKIISPVTSTTIAQVGSGANATARLPRKGAGILDGDLVAVHRTPEVRNRQIVVARLEDEVTVKRYRQEGKLVWLLPENPDYAPIKVDLNEQLLIIEGVVVGLLRQNKSEVP